MWLALKVVLGHVQVNFNYAQTSEHHADNLLVDTAS
jgi:hypothetical protein